MVITVQFNGQLLLKFKDYRFTSIEHIIVTVTNLSAISLHNMVEMSFYKRGKGRYKEVTPNGLAQSHIAIRPHSSDLMLL